VLMLFYCLGFVPIGFAGINMQLGPMMQVLAIGHI